MRIPLTRYGLPQAAAFPAIIIAAMGVCFLLGLNLLVGWIVIVVEIILLVLLLFVLFFFRDPKRAVPNDNNLLLAPADGTIADIELVESNDYIGSHALRIGIFLSIFNAHINRSPCTARVDEINYKKGKYKDARNPMAGKVNESNEIRLIKTDEPSGRIIVRQISGAIARRIVCNLKQGQILAGGEKFGMIKFGSRTELYLPAGKNAKCLVQVGDKVKAGTTALIRYD